MEGPEEKFGVLILPTSNLVGPLLPFGNGGSEAEIAQGRKAWRWHWSWETRVLPLLHSPGQVPGPGAPWREATLGLVYVGGGGLLPEGARNPARNSTRSCQSRLQGDSHV